MTYVINILHKNFSLIASDRLAKSESGITNLMVGSIPLTINSASEVTINGFKKIYLNADNSIAIGISGDACQHTYTNQLQNLNTTNEVLSTIISHNSQVFNIYDRDISLENYTVNAGIATFYDVVQQSFFTNLYNFSRIHNYTRLYAGTGNSTIIHIGSGQENFDEYFTPRINDFLSTIQLIEDIPKCKTWLGDVFKKISQFNANVGEEFSIFIATKDKPNFIEGFCSYGV